MESFMNKIISIESRQCEDKATAYYEKAAGLVGRRGKQYDRLRENSRLVRENADDRIDIKFVCSFFSDIKLDERELIIDGMSFSCPAFQQIPVEQVKGAYVYMGTAGDFYLEDAPVMDQLLADFWGTAFMDAGRGVFLDILKSDRGENFKSSGREKTKSTSGLYLSEAFGPGYFGMDTKQMNNLSALADNEMIGVTVKESGLLVPVKSCGGIYFVSDKPFPEIGVACKSCRGNISSCNICNVRKAGESCEAELPASRNAADTSPIGVAKNPKTFKCTGICSECGRCKNGGMIAGANDRKTRMLILPDDFQPDTGLEGYGVAFDIGTTTVVGMLVNLYSGEHEGTVAETNPQNAHGLDVISRITFAMKEQDNLKILRESIIKKMNHMINRLCEGAGTDKSAIMRVSVAGNTTMSHIFAGADPSALAYAPFNPAYTGTLMFAGDESGLNINPKGRVMLIPNIAGHVGGDITAGILASRLLGEKALTMFIDIGTNGEIVLTDGDKTLACSTAAGPAFEGAAIYQGMRAAPGAIEKVEIQGEKVLFSTVDNGEPVGICGSGLIDAVAQLRRAGVLSASGRLGDNKSIEKRFPGSGLAERCRERDGVREFVIVFKEDGEDIVITQKDIREVQLAKGAIAAGVSVMLQKLGKTVEDIDKVLIAGAFGNYIDKKSAVAIGLLPHVEPEKIHSMGNTAGTGAFMVVASGREADAGKVIPGKIEHLELADTENFQKEYIKAMNFR